MKETKVWIDREFPQVYFDPKTGNECIDGRPLILEDIKTHDRELVKEVCEKIREYLRTQVIYCGGQATELDIMIASVHNQVLEDVKQFLDQIQRNLDNE